MKFSSRTLFFVLFVAAITACSNDSHDHAKNITGKQLFEAHCVTCHDTGGTGRLALGVPANKGSKLSDLEILNKIRHGRGESTKMQIFEKMSEQEAMKIVKHLRTLEH